MDVHPGATFVAAIEGCTKSAQSPLSETPVFAFRRLPERMDWKPRTEPPPASAAKGILSFQPNPANGTTRLVTDMEGPLRDSVIHATGQTAMSATSHDGEFNVSALPAGMYLVRVENTAGAMRTARLVKE